MTHPYENYNKKNNLNMFRTLFEAKIAEDKA